MKLSRTYMEGTDLSPCVNDMFNPKFVQPYVSHLGVTRVWEVMQTVAENIRKL